MTIEEEFYKDLEKWETLYNMIKYNFSFDNQEIMYIYKQMEQLREILGALDGTKPAVSGEEETTRSYPKKTT